jgi:tetratricopeptide (TPR) repeat protein
MKIPEGLPPVLAETLEEAKKIRVDPEAYEAALRDWVAKGASSQYALAPDDVVRRSHPRPPEVARAAAYFEMGQHLYRSGDPDAAVAWWREAHRLQPDNWTYKRQAWALADPYQGRTEHYDSSWLDDVRAIGAENYYPPFVP